MRESLKPRQCNKSWNPGRPPSSWLFSHRADYAHLLPLLYFPPYYIFKFTQHSLHCVRKNDFLDSLKYFGTLCIGDCWSHGQRQWGLVARYHPHP